MIGAALLLLAADAANTAPQATTPFASLEVLSSQPRSSRENGSSCTEPVTVEISVTLAPAGKVDTVDVSPVDCDQGFESRLRSWITGLPSASFRSVTKPTTFSFRLHFLPEK